MTTDAGAAVRKMGHLEDAARRRSHGRWGRGDNHVPCALCNGDGDVCNPLNADPATKVTDWQPTGAMSALRRDREGPQPMTDAPPPRQTGAEDTDVPIRPVYVVCGSRDWPKDKLWFVTAKMIELIPHDAVVITGGARGVDRYAHMEAVRLRRATRVYEADWERHGKRAGLIRNTNMLTHGGPIAVLAFQWGGSRGTAHTIREAARLGVPCHRFTEDDLRPDIAALDAGDIE